MPWSEILGLDVQGGTDGELIDVMVTARRLASRLQAVELAAVAELARRRFAEDTAPCVEAISPREYVVDEVAEALTITATAADDLIRFATELTGRLPGTSAALAAGDLDYGKARTLWHGVQQVSGAVAARVEEKVLPKAPEQTTGEIRAKVRRLVRRLDREALDRRRQEAERRRDVQLVATDDGVAHLTGIDLPADAAGAAYNRVNAIAAAFKRDGDERAIGPLRADVFLALLSGTLAPAVPPTDATAARPVPGPGDASQPRWTPDDDAIADAMAQATREQLTELTSYLPGQGMHLSRPLKKTGRGLNPGSDLNDPDQAPADRERVNSPGRGQPGPYGGRAMPLERHHAPAALVAEAGERIRAALAVLKVGWCMPEHDRAGYRVPAGMRRLIEHRDRRCCFPGCRRPVRHCDADHSIPFHRDGPTCPCNVALLCRRHHRVKQTKDWHISQVWPGVLLWIGPTGHWRITAPADRE